MAVTEMVYDPEMGLIWALMPVQNSVSFVIGKSDSVCVCVGGAGRGEMEIILLSSLRRTHTHTPASV